MLDSHQHFWQLSQPFNYAWLRAPELAPICRDFLPEDILPHLRVTGIARSIFVQTQHDLAENRWVLGLAERYDFVAGVVGWVDLASPACADQLAEFRAHPKFVGVRHVTQDEPDDDFIIRPDVLRGLRVLERAGVPFDLLFYVKHLKHAATVARHVPTLPLVIDHLAKPRVREHALDDWLPAFRAAAACPNVYCKLSGLVTEAAWHAWTVADLQPYVAAALALFGPERLMFGSDWPVCELSASYEEVFASMRQALAPLSAAEREQIFGGTAAKFYRLPA
ncbi:MAG: amidohydrolase family protein [Planctomycetes bacterium]|nr:amidohydrolase family protein [Planctomycetota bacterium]